MTKIHLQSTRLFVNAGMIFPSCYANARLLDTDKGHLPSTSDKSQVTCKNCLRLFPIQEPTRES